jgi:hypothetical protein
MTEERDMTEEDNMTTVLLWTLIRQEASAGASDWLENQALAVKAEQGASELNMTFALLPRKMGGAPVASFRDWPLDRLCRVWLLTQVNPADKSAYLGKIENLFSGASMNELVALYSALPVLAYPGEWQKRCAEGIRSNIGTVLEAIMYENPYPSACLEEGAWNQMILKAFFTDKDIDRIVGVEGRANPALSAALFDYAQERRSAGRPINPQIASLIRKFVDYVL